MISARTFFLLVVSAAAAWGQGPTIAGCPKFPLNNMWNTAVDTLPVDAHSADYIANISATGGLRYDISIPYNVVPGTQPKVTMYLDSGESDPGPYPFPANALVEAGSDAHVIVVDKDNCMLYETWSSSVNADGSWTAAIGAKWDLRSNTLRPDTWSSADGAGLPILPGLLMYDEMVSGQINHALRFTAPKTQRAYVWPARHYASYNTSTTLPPMGQRFRLKASFDISGFSPNMQVVLRALKKYGLMLSDNGLPWEMQASLDSRWDENDLLTLRSVIGANLEAVDVSSLMVNRDSGRAGAACVYSLYGSPYFDADGQTGTIGVVTDPGCVWQTASSATWLTILSSSVVSGPNTIGVWLDANQTGQPRSAALGAGGNTLEVVQRQTTRLFSDVPPSDDYFDAINMMAQNSITKGCRTRPFSYCPDDQLSRGAAAVFVVRSIMRSDNFTYNPVPYFSDVPATHPYFPWIQKLKDLGMSAGCAASRYCPDEAFSRGQLAALTIGLRFGGTAAFTYGTTPYFTDVPATHPYFSWIQKTKETGIYTVCGVAKYCPEDTVTRRTAAMYLMRGGFNALLPWGTPYLTAISVTSVSAGQSVTVGISGQNTNFAAGTSTVDAGAGVTASGVNVLGPTSLVVTLNVASGVTTGPRSVTVRTGSEEATLPNGLRIQ